MIEQLVFKQSVIATHALVICMEIQLEYDRLTYHLLGTAEIQSEEEVKIQTGLFRDD